VAEGDRNRAGDLLGVARNTLRYKLNKYGLLD
jgi:DNA-binding protein Fis